jgi:hypothetical protein
MTAAPASAWWLQGGLAAALAAHAVQQLPFMRPGDVCTCLWALAM